MKLFYLTFTRVVNPVATTEPAGSRYTPPPRTVPKPFDLKVEGKAIIPAETARQALDTFEKEFPACEVNKISSNQED